jgi:hypothetical protein
MPYAERFSNPTRALSPRQLPTDHDHAVPTREYQGDQSSRMLLGCYRPCCPKPNPLKAHQRERVPAPPPVDWCWGARTVLAVKGSLRRAKQRRALDCCAPFRPDRYRDGRLRREHGTRLEAKDKRRAGLLRRRAGLIQNPSGPVGLDKVAPYQGFEYAGDAVRVFMEHNGVIPHVSVSSQAMAGGALPRGARTAIPKRLSYRSARGSGR